MNFFLDFETRSGADLREYGADVHVSHPWADVWCVGYAIDDAEVMCRHPANPFMNALLQDIARQDCKIIAHNAQFEWAVWNTILVNKYGVPPVPISRFVCTMATGYAMSLPGSLVGMSAALGIEQGKDLAGGRLAVQMASPRRIENGNPIWWDEEEKRERLYKYCAQDVWVEREVFRRLRPLPESEQKLWELDAAINQRGIYIDAKAGATAADAVGIEQGVSSSRLWVLTQGQVNGPSEVQKLKTWIEEQGVTLSSLAKQEVVDTLATDDLPPQVAEALQIRQAFAKTSTAKIRRMLDGRSANGRVKGTLQYHGSGTGRWAGRRVQPHNLPRPTIEQHDIEEILDYLATHDVQSATEYIKVFHGPPLVRIADCLRGLICAAPGNRLCAGDYSNIEGRALAWLAGESWKVKAFDDFDKGVGHDLYLLAASRIYKKPVETYTKKSPERQIGKVAELACLGAETKVLTSNGVKAILDVTKNDWLWDGVDWVQHEGVICNGIKETVNLAGIELTPDHLILTGQTWTQARQLGSNESMLCRALATGSANLPLLNWTQPQQGHCHRWFGSDAHAGRRHIKCTTGIYEKGAVPGVTVARRNNQAVTEKTIQGTLESLNRISTGGGCSTELRRVLTDAEIRMTQGLETMERGESQSTPRGLGIEKSFCGISHTWRAGTKRNWNSIGSTLTEDTNRGTYGFSRKLRIKPIGEQYSRYSNDSLFLRPVYDIVSAGPRSRFTVIADRGPLLVHNCGYQGGVGAFQTMAVGYGVKIPDHEADAIKTAWRDAHPNIKRYWYNLEDAAVHAVQQAGVVVSTGPAYARVSFKVQGAFLWCRLPSGRALCYPYPQIKEYESPWGVKMQLSYMSVDDTTRQWQRTQAYGGKLAENITQAVARDILAASMMTVEQADWRIIFHVHDEIVTETKHGELDDFLNLMRIPPPWASGLPIAVEGWTGIRYRK